MTDSYLNVANSGIGARLTAMLGLPQPWVLERYQAGQAPVSGTLLLGGGGEPQLLATLAATFECPSRPLALADPAARRPAVKERAPCARGS